MWSSSLLRWSPLPWPLSILPTKAPDTEVGFLREVFVPGRVLRHIAGHPKFTHVAQQFEVLPGCYVATICLDELIIFPT